MDDGGLQPRVTSLEGQVKDLRARLKATEQDAAAARVLAGAADRDVEEIRGELRDFRRATIASLNAMREDLVGVREDLGVVRDGLGVVREDVVGVRQDLGVVREGLGVVREDVVGVRGDLAAVQDGLAEVRRDFGGVQDGLAEVRGDLAVVRDGLAEVRGDFAGVQDGLVDVNGKVVAMEATVGGLAEEMRNTFALATAGQQQIVGLLEVLVDRGSA